MMSVLRAGLGPVRSVLRRATKGGWLASCALALLAPMAPQTVRAANGQAQDEQSQVVKAAQEAAPRASRVAAPRAALLAPPPLAFQQWTLSNGLQVLALPEAGGGSVSVQVWYRVGGKDDPPGRSGFAHLFEHLMFKATRHLKAEQFDRLTEDVGGNNNAFTADDVTTYQSVVPSHHLERILWAEAERMSNLRVDEASFQSERAVVQEEYRQRVLASPYGLLFEAIAPNAFARHPYRRGVIGSIADLDAASLEDVRRFHATYYRPDNAILIVTGDFDLDELRGWVRRYFEPLQRPESPIPRVSVEEPRRTQARQVAVTGPNVPLPAALQIWQGPSARHPDAPVWAVVQGLLAGGESSRLNQSLVYRQRVAQSAGFSAQLNTDAGYLMAYAIAAGTRSPQGMVAPLMAEIRRLAQGPIPAAELDKVKSLLLTAALTERQTPLGQGMVLGTAAINLGDPAQANQELLRLQAVTAADVQRVLRQHILSRPAVTLFYSQAPAAAPAPAAASGG